MSKLKEEIAKRRLGLTAATLRIYNEKYLKGDAQDPFTVLEEIMINSPRDSDRIKAATEIIRMCYQRPPTESEVHLTDESTGAALSEQERDELRMIIESAQKGRK